MKQSNFYNHSADFIRSLAIFLVIVVHVFSEFLAKSTAFNSFDWWSTNVFETVGKIAVPLFIMLSGLLILDSRKNYSIKTFYQKRLARIGIPILFWPFFFYFGFLFVGHKAFNFLALVNNYIFLNMFYHLYFLFIILGLYIVAPFLKKLLSQLEIHEKKFLLILLFTFSICVTFMVYFTPTKINYWSIFTVFIPFIGYFIAGDFFRSISLNKKQMFLTGAAFVVLLALTGVSKYFAYKNGSSMFIRYFDDVLSINVILMSLLSYVYLLNLKVEYAFLYQEFIQNLFTKVAALSFGIYIIHPLILYFYDRLLDSQFILITPVLLSLCLKITIVFAISFVIILVAKKIQLVRLLFGS